MQAGPSRSGRRDDRGRGASGRAAPPPARADRRRARRDPRAPGRPRTERRRARDVQRDVERALLVQELEASAVDPADDRSRRHRRPRRERRRDLHRGRPRGRVQDRIAQPPERGRAIPGRGDRCRRDPPRHLHDGRPPDCGTRRVALRRPGLGAHAPPRRWRGQGRGRVRQLRRRADDRRGAGVRRVVRGQPARQRDGDRAARGTAAHAGRGARPGQPRRAVRIGDGSGRDRRGVRAGVRDLLRTGPVQATFGAGGRPVRGEAADRSLARAHRARTGGGSPGPRRGRHHLRDVGDRGPGGHRDPDRP